MLQHIRFDLGVGCAILKLRHVHVFQRELNPDILRVDLALGKQDNRLISPTPEEDALDRLRAIARKCGVEEPRLIGWDFPCLSQEQLNVYHMHGYAAAWILPEGTEPEGMEILEQPPCRYAAIHIDRPFENPFVTIPKAYRTLMDYMRLNGLEHTEESAIPCFETAGETMDIYIACQ